MIIRYTFKETRPHSAGVQEIFYNAWALLPDNSNDAIILKTGAQMAEDLNSKITLHKYKIVNNIGD